MHEYAIAKSEATFSEIKAGFEAEFPREKTKTYKFNYHDPKGAIME